MRTYSCSCRSLDPAVPFDFADIICGSCTLCGHEVHTLDDDAGPSDADGIDYAGLSIDRAVPEISSHTS